MKNNLYVKLIAILCLFAGQTVTAQDGMDYSGGPSVRYSKLRSSFPPVLQNQNSEKALGVYQGIFIPQSFLEVNSTPAYMPFPMPGLGLGEVFRTDAGGTNSFWRMRRNGNEFGLLFNNNNNHFGLQATAGDMFFNTGGANERVRIKANGDVIIKNPNGIIVLAEDNKTYFRIKISSEGKIFTETVTEL